MGLTIFDVDTANCQTGKEFDHIQLTVENQIILISWETF